MDEYDVVPEVGGQYHCGMDGSVWTIHDTKDVGGTLFALISEQNGPKEWAYARFWLDTDTWGYLPPKHGDRSE